MLTREVVLKKFCTAMAMLISPICAFADELTQHVEIRSIGTSTYYVDSYIHGSGDAALLIDTGSGYSTINQETLKRLTATGDATFVKTLEGVMANDARMIVPVYRISGLTLGGKCSIADIEVAVFPSGTRQILGLSALTKLSPFTFNVNPPRLTLSNCQSGHTSANAGNPIKETNVGFPDSADGGSTRLTESDRREVAAVQSTRPRSTGSTVDAVINRKGI
jgi:Aspartyl protease